MFAHFYGRVSSVFLVLQMSLFIHFHNNYNFCYYCYCCYFSLLVPTYLFVMYLVVQRLQNFPTNTKTIVSECRSVVCTCNNHLEVYSVRVINTNHTFRVMVLVTLVMLILTKHNMICEITNKTSSFVNYLVYLMLYHPTHVRYIFIVCVCIECIQNSLSVKSVTTTKCV